MSESEQTLLGEVHADLARIGPIVQNIISPLVKAGWAGAVAVFMLGGWAASLQIQSAQDRSDIASLKSWRESQATDMSTLIERVNGIRDDVAEIKADLKSWKPTR